MCIFGKLFTYSILSHCVQIHVTIREKSHQTSNTFISNDIPKIGRIQDTAHLSAGLLTFVMLTFNMLTIDMLTFDILPFDLLTFVMLTFDLRWLQAPHVALCTKFATISRLPSSRISFSERQLPRSQMPSPIGMYFHAIDDDVLLPSEYDLLLLLLVVNQGLSCRISAVVDDCRPYFCGIYARWRRDVTRNRFAFVWLGLICRCPEVRY